MGTIQSEPEMKKIRNDINDAESARIPVLDDEQRREIIVERGLSLQERGGDENGLTHFGINGRGLAVLGERSLEERIYMNVEERFAGALEKIIAASLEKITADALEKITASTLEKRMSMAIDRILKMSETVEPSLAPFSQVRLEKIEEVVPSTNESGTEEKQIDLMEVPDENRCGEKRKAVSPGRQDANEATYENAKKKVKNAYTCDLCQVSATSQHGLDSHVRGKKHKLKVASSKLQNEKKDIDDDLLRPNIKAKGDAVVSGIEQNDVLPQKQASSDYTKSGTDMLAKGDVDVTGIKLKDVLPQELTASEHTKSGTFLQAKGDADVTGIKLKDVLPQEQAASEYTKSGTLLQAKGDVDVIGRNLKDVLPQEQAASEYAKSGTVLLAKGDADVSGIKLKDVLPQEQAAREHTKSSDPKKTAVGGWNCELCQVILTSQSVYDTHIQGKKHKSKEAAALKLETNRKHLNESLPTEEAEKKSVGENDPSLLQRCEKIDSGNNKTSEDDFTSSQHETQGMLFWCKTCNVGANSESDMETHRKGKKHILKAALTNRISNNVVAGDNLTKSVEVDLCDNDTTEDDLKSSRQGKKGMVFRSETSNVGANSEVVMETHWKGAQEVLKAASTNKISNNVDASDNLTKGVEVDLCDNNTSEDDLKSSRHRKKGMVFWCETCNVGANSEVVMETHWKGKKHASKIKAASTNKISNNVVAGDDPMNGGVWNEDDVRSSV